MALESCEEAASKPAATQAQFEPSPKLVLAIVLAFLLAIVFIYTPGVSSSRLQDRFVFGSPKPITAAFRQTVAAPEDPPAAALVSARPTPTDLAATAQPSARSASENLTAFRQTDATPTDLAAAALNSARPILEDSAAFRQTDATPLGPAAAALTTVNAAALTGASEASDDVAGATVDPGSAATQPLPLRATPPLSPSSHSDDIAYPAPTPAPSSPTPHAIDSPLNDASAPTAIRTRIPASILTSPPQATMWTRIPGSTLTSPDSIRAFRARFECITREGAWAHYVSPRVLPWPDEISKCDEYHLGKSPRHVAMQQADHVAAQAQEIQTKIAEISGKLSGGAGGGMSLPLNQIKQLRQQEKQLRNQHGKLAKQWAVRETLRYQWVVPDAADGSSSNSNSSRNCGPWEWFSPHTFCRVLHGRNLLIVGDSINHLLADALRFNLRLGAKDPDGRLQWVEPTAYCQKYRTATKPPGDRRCWTLNACSDLGFSVTIFFVRDYYLNSTEAVNDFMVDKSFGSRSGETWIEDIGAQNVSIVVMNRGAHFIATPQFQRQMRSTLREVRARYPELLIIVRNTPAGHPSCWMHRTPVKTPLKLPHSDWHWDDFDAQNEVLKRMVEGEGEGVEGREEAGKVGAKEGAVEGGKEGVLEGWEGKEEGIGGVYMDVNGPTVLRADGHVGRWDCLHYCHPGPVDTWVQLLYNMLLGLLSSSYDT